MTTNFKVKVMQILDVVLRVPPIFVMDAILNKGYSYEYAYQLKPLNLVGSQTPSQPSHESTVSESSTSAAMQSVGTGEARPSLDYVFASSISFDLQTIILFSVHMTGFLMAFVIFLLSREHLLATYKWLLSIGMICLSYWLTTTYLSKEETISGFPSLEITSVWIVLLLQMILTTIFTYMQYTHSGMLGVIALFTFVLPPALGGVPLLPKNYIKTLPMLSAILSLTLIKLCFIMKLKNIYLVLRNGIRRSQMIIRYYGLHTLLENEWLRLNVPHVLRVFWLTRIMEHVVYMVADQIDPPDEMQTLITTSLDDFSKSVKDVLVHGCNTIVAILGMTSVVASVAHYFGSAMQHFLLTEDEEEKSIGTVSAVLFFILALQTGLTGLEPEKRFIRLYRNFCLLFTAILHFIHNMVNPLLMSLSASRNRSVQRHGRALAVCGFLILFPSWFLTYLWNHHSVSTWLLAVSAFSIEVMIKVIITLLIYLLFMIDAYRNTFWEKLDDYVYYIRAVGNSIEFVLGIFLFFNGAWILLFESGGAIRACMMCIHAYFNIWLQARSGWRTFIKRRTAVNKINALPEATEEQLRQFDDVCAICYQELTNARITKCNHYFHGVCLRKWLYVQDRCPLCHDTLYKLGSDTDESSPVRNRNWPASDNINNNNDANAANEPQDNADPPAGASDEGHPAEEENNAATSSEHVNLEASNVNTNINVNSYAVDHEHQD